ncbi:MAG TPA: cytochrome c oxidase subunit II [Gaiellaceae bacterium]|nr:cytochrome c oxidase subunit II [Gaiellaceae bacterium]
MRRKPTLFAASALAAALLTPAAQAGNGGFAPIAPESPNAHSIHQSYLFISIFTAAIFVMVETLLIVFVFRYRRRRRPRFEEGAPIHGATNLELLWTAFPVVVLFLIASFIFIKLPGIVDVPSAGVKGQLEIKVTGRQFYWQFEYPNGVVSIDTMRAPAGVPVYLQVTSPPNDVIHSWWIPALGGKIDAIPGRLNHTWFQVAKTGTYKGQCAELCGLEHANMLASVQVMRAGAFDSWLFAEKTAQVQGTSTLGKQEWAGVCAKCHGLAGEGGIAKAIAGSSLLTDPRAIESIIRNGTTTPQGTMPPVASGWSQEQVDALTRYLKEHPPSGS